MKTKFPLLLAIAVSLVLFGKVTLLESPVAMASFVAGPATRVWQVDATHWQVDPSILSEVWKAIGSGRNDLKVSLGLWEAHQKALFLMDIPKGHVLEQIGFRTGDVLQSINERDMGALYGLGGLFFCLSKPSEIRVSGIRRGQPFEWIYRVRPADVSQTQSVHPLNLLNPFFYLSGLAHALFA